MPFTDYANTFIDYVNTFIHYVNTSGDCIDTFTNYAHTSDDYANTFTNSTDAPNTPTLDFCIPYSSLLQLTLNNCFII